MSLAEAVAQTGVPDFEFDPPRAGKLFRPAEFD
jgi:hypothetical protein